MLRQGMRGAMGLSWGDFTQGLDVVLSGGVSLVAPAISQATGWDLNANDSPVFRDYVRPIANYVGDAFGYGPAGDYLAGTAQAIAGKVPLPPTWTGGQLPANILDQLGNKGSAPAGSAPAGSAPAPGPKVGGPRSDLAAGVPAQIQQLLTAHGYKTGVWPEWRRGAA